MHAITLGSFAVVHDQVSMFVNGDGPDRPPAAAITVAASTTTIAASYGRVVVSVVDTITDAEYRAMLPIGYRQS